MCVCVCGREESHFLRLAQRQQRLLAVRILLTATAARLGTDIFHFPRFKPPEHPVHPSRSLCVGGRFSEDPLCSGVPPREAGGREVQAAHTRGARPLRAWQLAGPMALGAARALLYLAVGQNPVTLIAPA